MLGTLHGNDMAETLMVLAGGNAGNAARHFANTAYAAGNIDAALVWARVVESAEILLRDLSQAERLSAQTSSPSSRAQPAYDLVRISSLETAAAFAERPPRSGAAPSRAAGRLRPKGVVHYGRRRARAQAGVKEAAAVVAPRRHRKVPRAAVTPAFGVSGSARG
jgi:hypothetical protein